MWNFAGVIMKKDVIFRLYLPLFLLMALIYNLGYNTPREHFLLFFSQYLGAFLLFFTIYSSWSKTEYERNRGLLFVSFVLAHAILILAPPQLSNDFYRFIWDGELLTRGINPFAHTPNELISHTEFFNSQYYRSLYHGMGELSQAHYSCYPVVNQALFFPGAFFFDNIGANVISLRIIVILGDVLTFIYMIKLLKLLGLKQHLAWLYLMNPLILLEFTGNLHFEGVMIGFILMATYYLLRLKIFQGGVALALAIQTKLNPLLLLPLFFKYIKFNRSLILVGTSLIFSIFIGGILISEQGLANMLDSINEYFVRFEFNGSIFYLFRELGFLTIGHDPIQFMGPILSVLTFVIIMAIALFKRIDTKVDVMTALMFGYVTYYLFATTVHPWYITMALAFSIFTQYRFVLVWSLMIGVSYFAYGEEAFKENGWLILLEYLVVYGIMFYEIFRYSSRKTIALQLKDYFSKAAD